MQNVVHTRMPAPPSPAELLIADGLDDSADLDASLPPSDASQDHHDDLLGNTCILSLIAGTDLGTSNESADESASDPHSAGNSMTTVATAIASAACIADAQATTQRSSNVGCAPEEGHTVRWWAQPRVGSFDAAMGAAGDACRAAVQQCAGWFVTPRSITHFAEATVARARHHLPVPVLHMQRRCVVECSLQLQVHCKCQCLALMLHARRSAFTVACAVVWIASAAESVTPSTLGDGTARILTWQPG